MKTLALITTTLALALCGCTRNDDLSVIKTADIPQPAKDIVVRQEKLGDANLLLLEAVDWRTWKLTFPEIKPTDNFVIQLLLTDKTTGEARIVGEMHYMPYRDAISLDSAPYVLVSLFPLPLTDSVMKAKELKIKAVFGAANWKVGENQGGAWAGTSVDRVVPNYHLGKDGSAMGINPQGGLPNPEPGRYMLDRGYETELILNISRIPSL